jgi:hypothetical protein
MALRSLALASIHKSVSSPTRRRALSILGVAPLNTTSFLVFQILHAPSTTKVLHPCCKLVCNRSLLCCHQASNTWRLHEPQLCWTTYANRVESRWGIGGHPQDSCIKTLGHREECTLGYRELGTSVNKSYCRVAFNHAHMLDYLAWQDLPLVYMSVAHMAYVV